jgi:hypothetical protein
VRREIVGATAKGFGGTPKPTGETPVPPSKFLAACPTL